MPPKYRTDYVTATNRGVGLAVQAPPVMYVEEQGNDVVHRTVFNLVSLPVTCANTTGISFGSKKLYTWLQGRILLIGGIFKLSFNWAGTGISATGSGDLSFGTTQTADATLSGTDVDLAASQAMVDPAVAGVTTSNGFFVKTTEFDGTATAKDMCLNVIIDDAAVADGNSSIVLVTGQVQFTWISQGDY